MSVPFSSLVASRKYLQARKQLSGWPYLPGQPPSVESTSWCYLALRHEPLIVQQATTFFQQSQNPDGGWSTQANLGGSDWTTALALLSWQILSVNNDKIASNHHSCFEQGLSLLLGQRQDALKPLTNTLLVLLYGPQILDNYPIAWPWTPNTYYWVEPTSYALLLLKSLAKNHKQQAAVEDGNNFLLRHGCQGGGWNRGDNTSLGVHQPPAIITTALALLALQDRRSQPEVQAGLDYLEKVSDQQFSVMSLAWLALARDAYGLDTRQQLMSLSKLQRSDGSFGDNMYLTALAVCALDIAHAGNLLKLDSSRDT